MRIAILTGASSGLGREYARQITAQDHDIDEVWAIARRKERLDELPRPGPASGPEQNSFAGRAEKIIGDRAPGRPLAGLRRRVWENL